MIYSSSWTVSKESKNKEQPPKRIVSTSGASDETLHALLSKDASLERLVAVSSIAHQRQFSFLSELFTKDHLAPKILFSGGSIATVGSHIESIVQQNPDLVIASEYNHAKLLHALKKMHIPAIVLERFQSLDHIIDHTKNIAHATHTSQHVDFLVRPLLKEIQPLNKKHGQIISIMFYHPTHYVLGDNTLPNDLIERSGMRNIITQSGWNKLSLEAISRQRPDFIIAPCFAHEKANVIDRLSKQPGWRSIPAVKQNRVLCIEHRALYSTSFEIIHAYRQLKQEYLIWQKSMNVP